jgi:hypothetical protein
LFPRPIVNMAASALKIKTKGPASNALKVNKCEMF